MQEVEVVGQDEDTLWQGMLREAWHKPEQLIAAGYVPARLAQSFAQFTPSFQFRVPREYASLMETDWHKPCPIRRQVLPSMLEYDPVLPAWISELCQQLYQQPTPWRQDAIADQTLLAANRLTHRYADRVLLHVSPACAMYCRFCFRKVHMQEREASLYQGNFEHAVNYIEQHTEISEVILTGGDPLSLSNSALHKLCTRLASITHVKVLRLHSRMPVTLPHRITTSLLQSLRHLDVHVVLMTHFNHAVELRSVACVALQRLRQAGVTLENQTVLLRGVNDTVAALEQLFGLLYRQGVHPIYLHHPDLTPGTFGFRLSIAHGRHLMEQLTGLLPGAAIPRYVLDLPGGHGKAMLQDYRIQHIWQRHEEGLIADFYQLPTNSLLPESPTSVNYLDLYAAHEQPLFESEIA